MACRRVRSLTTVPALLALLLALLAPFGQHAAAASPDLRLRPNDGLAGARVLADGRDFAPFAAGSLLWPDGATLGEFTADGAGDFAVEITIPLAPAGSYEVVARAGPDEAADEFEVEAETEATEGETTATPVASAPSPVTEPPLGAPATGGLPASDPRAACESAAGRRIAVSTAAALTAALAAARPGNVIDLADGTYAGTFVAATSGSAEARIALCGSRRAVIDGGDVGTGYALHITGDFWTVAGITVTNALKGIMLDDADYTVLAGLAVHTIGHEAVHFRTHSADNVIADSEIFDTGLKKAKFGEGVYIGSAVSNWGRYTGGEPNRSDRNQVLRNRIWNTTAEAIDVKEGTTGGLIKGNLLDGAGLTGADSWVDLKGNGYLVRANTGTNSPADGFQTHVINDLPWGRDNLFAGNVATVNGSGYGFYIHDPDESNNLVACDNQVSGAESGFANVPCSPAAAA